ncbi:MAG: GTPase HflX [Eubacteriales bacterium]|nr:GTPase HflX [Eubacteriales bacterium]
MYFENKEEKARVLLAGVYETFQKDKSREDFDHSMNELWELTKACDMEPVHMITQQLDHMNNAIYLGTGKLDEIIEYIEEEKPDMLILNDTLSPIQLRNLQKELKIKVMDRTALILEIFSDRARSHEAKLQVELAKLQYLKPRLIGLWEKQNRQGGASGSMSSKGEGETQLELDRREIDHRLAELRRELKVVQRERETQRKKRNKAGIPMAALVGYTNAGKSTIMNRFVGRFAEDSEKKVFEANMLFATLDTTVRRITPGRGKEFLLSDTVGFIEKLPTALVEAFKSTLEVALEADLLIQVVDRSDPHYKDHMAVTNETLRDLGAGHIPMITVFNKADLCDPKPEVYPHINLSGDSIVMSAAEDSSIDMLSELIIKKLYGEQRKVTFLIPFTDGAAVSYLQGKSNVISVDYSAEGTLLTCMCSEADAERFAAYISEEAD